MLNEIEEFKAYTGKPEYKISGSRDSTYLGRFTLDMITKFYGLHRVLTIIARGYMFRGSDPYSNIDYTRRALCAWCSLPGKNPDPEKEKWKYKTNFAEYHDEFPELVDKKGRGWFYRHVHSIIQFLMENEEAEAVLKKKYFSIMKLMTAFDKKWRSKLKQFQIPLFDPKTKSAWVMVFDSIIADAIELGELRDRSFSFSADQQKKIKDALPKGLPYRAAETVLAYCIANKPEDSDWTVIPVTNFDAYFGSTTFSKKWLSLIPEDLLVRETCGGGVCRGKARI